MMLQDVSIVIPNWNGSRFLRDCLGSIYESAEVVVVDNGSTDDSVQLIESLFPRVKIVKNRRNVGFSAANNLGVKYATGAHLLFLNNDTVVKQGSLELMRHAFDYDPLIGVVGARLQRPDGRIQSASARQLVRFSLEVRRILTLGDRERVYGFGVDYSRSQYTQCVSGAALMIRRNVLGEVGGWPEEYFAYAEDVDLCRRVLERGYRIWYEARATVIHFHGGSGKGRTLWHALRLHFINHSSINMYIGRYEGKIRALLHAALYPVDLLLTGLRLGKRLASHFPRSRSGHQP